MSLKNKTKLIITALAVGATACGSDGDEPSRPDVPATPDQPTTAVTAPKQAIYQVNPRFYGERDCLKAVTADIPRIASMGIDVLWVMPIQPIGTVKSVGSPYCIKDYKGVGEKLGTVDDFKELVAAAHSHGMKVILDWVGNHTAFDNVWTVTNPERYRKDANGNIAATASWGDVAQLDYNVDSTAEGMKDAMKFWIDTADIDGFRCDYAEGVPHAFWQDAITSLNKTKPGLIMLAESGQTSFWGDGFDMVYDWNFSPAMKTLFNGGTPAAFQKFTEDRNSDIAEGKSLLRYAFNHDVASENEIDRLYGSAEAIPAAYVLAAMTGGTPMIYSSMDAEGLKGKLSFFNHRTLTYSQDLTKEYAAINKAYKSTAEARSGQMRFYPGNDAVSFSMTNGGKTVYVIVNPRGKSVNVTTPISLRGTSMTDLISGKTAELAIQVSLPAYGYAILGN